MKNWKLKNCFCIVTALVMLFSTSVAYASEEGKKNPSFDYTVLNEGEGSTKATVTMSKDTVYSGTLKAGQVDTYYFTPSYSGMFTIETFGSTDTYGTVTGHSGYPSGALTNDDDGEDHNFAIGFLRNAGGKVTIKVRHFNASSGTGSYTIQVRDQRAQIYTFNYPGLLALNTTGDATIPASWLSSMGYSVGNHKNKAASHVDGIIATTFRRLNSEVVFFAGHGDAGLLAFNDGTNYSYLYDNSAAFTSISPSPRKKPMGNTKVAVWASCYSATDPDGADSRLSLTDRAVSSAVGARSAIGWNLSLNDIAARAFTNQLFLEFGHTMTVSAAAQSAANSLTWPFDNAKKYVLKGSLNTLVAYSTVTPKGVASTSVSQEEFDADMKNFDYVAYELYGDGTRYYKTINGLLTNDYYDVFDNGGGNIITKSKNTFSQKDVSLTIQQQLVESTYHAEKSVVANGISFGELIKSDDHTVYVKIKEQIIPIKIIYADYESDSKISYQKVTCINLLDNSLIDYEDICTDK